MPSYYTGDLASLNGAHVAQQDADTRAALAQLQYLQSIIQAGVNRDQTASRERTANRGYQSEDTRTAGNLAGTIYGTDAQQMLGLDSNAVARMRAISDAANATEQNSIARAGLGTQLDIAKLNAETQKAIAAESVQRYLALNKGGITDPQTLSVLAQLTQNQQATEEARKAKEIADRNAIGLVNAQVNTTPSWFSLDSTDIEREKAKLLANPALAGVGFPISLTNTPAGYPQIVVPTAPATPERPVLPPGQGAIAPVILEMARRFPGINIPGVTQTNAVLPPYPQTNSIVAPQSIQPPHGSVGVRRMSDGKIVYAANAQQARAYLSLLSPTGTPQYTLVQ